MRYLICDTEGAVHERLRHGHARDLINQEVGPEGFDIVSIRRGMWVGQLCGFVNDCGLLAPETYPRNTIGSCLLAALGANAQIYAGPVVVTGWDEFGPDTEICGLSDELATAVMTIHGDIRRALGLDAGELRYPQAASWAENMRTLAEHVASGATPTIQIITDPEDVVRTLFGGAS